jgi:UDP-N-acetylenolpyruvoylglucosamine reductase
MKIQFNKFKKKNEKIIIKKVNFYNKDKQLQIEGLSNGSFFSDSCGHSSPSPNLIKKSLISAFAL